MQVILLSLCRRRLFIPSTIKVDSAAIHLQLLHRQLVLRLQLSVTIHRWHHYRWLLTVFRLVFLLGLLRLTQWYLLFMLGLHFSIVAIFRLKICKHSTLTRLISTLTCILITAKVKLVKLLPKFFYLYWRCLQIQFLLMLLTYQMWNSIFKIHRARFQIEQWRFKPHFPIWIYQPLRFSFWTASWNTSRL